MTIYTLALYIGIAAVLLTLLNSFLAKAKKGNPLPMHWPVNFVKNFTGSLFIFSGAVKAIDPMGTAFKMEQYFQVFNEYSLLKAFTPLAPYALSFAVIMIVMELVVGVTLLLGIWRRLSVWILLLTIVFFTFLTGFTAYTGKVTDCGCFGDFLKLKPIVSFGKDVVLLVLSLILLVGQRHILQYFKGFGAFVIAALATAGSIFFCMSNYVWDEPIVDFRPFAEGVDLYVAKNKCIASTPGKTMYYVYKNAKTGKEVSLSSDDIMKPEFAYLYEEEGWKVDETKTTEKNFPKTYTHFVNAQGDHEFADEKSLDLYPAADGWKVVETFTVKEYCDSKVKEFEVKDFNGNDVTTDILMNPDYTFMVVSYDLHLDVTYKDVVLKDTVMVVDTVRVTPDSFNLVPRIASIQDKTVKIPNVKFDGSYNKRYTDVLNTFAEAVEKDGKKLFVITKLNEYAVVEDFRHEVQAAYPFYQADDIMLKTIIRSNPGVLLLKKGVVVKKWHWRQLPDFAKVKAEYMK